MTYWLVVCVLLGSAFVFIIPPLWKKREIKVYDSEQRNVRIAKDRADDLKQQLESGALTQLQFDEQYEELEYNLGDDLQNDDSVKNIATQGRWVIPVIMICIPLFSLVTYLVLGEPDALVKAQQQQMGQSAAPSQQDINAMVNGLAQRLKNEPDNANGWIMLGRSYKHLEKYDLAVNAYKQAYELLGNETEVMLHYADSLIMANQGALTEKASDLIFKALQQSPNNITALWLGGMAKAAIGERVLALEYWTKLEKLLPPGSDSLRQLQRMMASLNTQDNESIAATKPKIESQAEKSIKVQVTAHQSVLTSVSPKDTVFIYAKAVTGPPMPLAIVKKTVADLPVSVVLDDTLAMMPAMKLSNYNQVTVVARISKSGQAMQQKGDFIGTFEVKQLSAKKLVSIEIIDQL